MATYDDSRVKDFYDGRSVLITGATGFIGKVLVEKLLRSCPDIEKIYVLIRAKKGKTVQQRLNGITNKPLFEKLKCLYPDAIQKKLKGVVGDVCELGLGLSNDDRKLITDNVSIIFHGAASVRFDDPLKRAILLNTRGTREIVRLALDCKHLVALLHISTTYCQLDKLVVREQAYPPLGDWEKTIEIAENIDEYTLDIVSNKYTNNMPNTYTFTKRLAEQVIYDMCKDRIPAIIFRPSIIISTMYDPMPGWIENFNGPVALLVATGKGILRTSFADPKNRADYVPVDIAVRGLIVAAWQKGRTSNIEQKLDVTFYNVSNNNMHSITTGEMNDFGKQLIWESPLSTMLWFPKTTVTLSKTWNYINTILFQVLPAIVIDKIFTMTDRKPILLKIQRRIYIANMALQIFITNQWSFLNDNARGLMDNLLLEELDEFGYDPDNVDVFGYFRNCVIHGKKYLLNEDEALQESAKANLYRMFVLDKTVKFLFYVFVFWILFYKVDIVDHASRFGYKIFDTLFNQE